MSEVLKWVGMLLGIWAGYQVILFVMTLVQLLRWPCSPVQVVLDDDAAPATHTLPPDQKAWLGELQALGFDLLWMGRLTRDGHAPAPVAFLRHRTEPVVAAVTFTGTVFTLYPVHFGSEDAQGRLLITQNRAGYVGVPERDDTVTTDVYVDDLSDHFQAHLATLSQAQLPSGSTLDARRVADRLVLRVESTFDLMRAHGQLTGAAQTGRAAQTAHYRLKAAARIAWDTLRVRQRLVRPYRSSLTQGEHLAGFLAHCHLLQDQLLAARPARHNVKASVLVLSMAVTLALWGWVFDPVQALALVGILLVHECGHALAMRAFGWKDMNMFFVPFMGAMVTGRPASIPAWKQAIVLLAGPLPGLFAGAAYLWLGHPSPDAAINLPRIAGMAVAVNLFNLLPLNPLDGGQLVDGIVFRRWPRLRAAFTVVSCLAFMAMAIHLQQPVFWGLFVWLAVMLPTLWRMGQIDVNAPDANPDPQLRLQALYAQVKALFPKVNLFRLQALVKGALQRQTLTSPRWWESVGTLLVLVAIWGGTAGGYFALMGRHGQTQDDHRSAAQQSFDQVWDNDDDVDTGEPRLKAIQQAARSLTPDDPRHFDVDVSEARGLPPAYRRERYAALIQSGRKGVVHDASSLLTQELDRVWMGISEQPPAERLAALQDALGWAERTRPKDLQATVDTRLRLIEATDELGQTDQARQDLEALRQRAEHDEDCRCSMRPILRAQAWFFMSHGDGALALRVLETSPYIDSIRAHHDGLSLDHGWVLLLAGQNQAGIAQIKAASQTEGYEPGWLARLQGKKPRPPRVTHRMDLAYALQREGRPPDALRSLLRGGEAAYNCERFAGGHAYEDWYPWQRERDRLLSELARAHCAPPP